MNIVRPYIQYLRDVSRKIINRAGFENVLPPESRRKKNYYFALLEEIARSLLTNNEYIINDSNSEFSSYLRNIYNYLSVYSDQKLFVGLGIIHGKHYGRKICAPLFFGIIELDYEEHEKKYTIYLNKDSLQINYDILANFMNIILDEEDEEAHLSPKELEKYKLIEEVENILIINSSIDNIEVAFKKLKEIEEFQQIQLDMFSDQYREFIYEIRYCNTIDNILFDNHHFLFVHKVPDELSTYEALNSLLKKNTIQNNLLEKLIENALYDTDTDFNVENISTEDIEENLQLIPMSLSNKQKESIRKIWSNGITYIEGPPGTGKSYTITAIMILAFLLNKKVLLVSHKKAALDVVKKNVDIILGNNAVIYIGVKDKNETRVYLESIVSESDNRREIDQLFRTWGEIEHDISELNKEIENSENQVMNDIQNENNYYNTNRKFIEERNSFFMVYTKHNPKNYIFNNILLRRENFYKKAIEKYNENLKDKQIRRIDLLYTIKLKKHFINALKAHKDYFNDVNYLWSIFKLNKIYSESISWYQKINEGRLKRNLEILAIKKEEKKNKLSDFLRKYFKHHILSQLSQSENDKRYIRKYNYALSRRNPRIVQDIWEQIDFNRLTKILPLWCSKLRDLGNVFPLEKEIFDLVIVDESSQVNIAEIIPAFYRGKRFCIVGDDKQLHLNATGVGFALSKSFDRLCWNKNKLHEVIALDEAKNRNLVVSEASILKFINRRSAIIPNTQLDEHYRSMPQLASFNSNMFYDFPWKIMTENGENIKRKCFKPIKVDGRREQNQKYVEAEIQGVVDLLKNLMRNEGFKIINELKPFEFESKPSLGVISILTNQKNKIEERLYEEGFTDDEIDQYNLMIGTPEEFQGNERDIIIITLGLDENSRWGKQHYENENRFNVLTSRAKFFTYFIYAGIPRTASLLKRYLNHFGVTVGHDDEIYEQEPINSWSFDPKKCELNTMNFDSDFERKVCEVLITYTENKPEIEIFNQVNACGQKRLDFVLYNKNNKVTCALEVDGKEHFTEDGRTYTEYHLDRIAVLKRAGWKIVHVKYYNWYENGWLCDNNNQNFQREKNRLFSEINEHWDL